MPIGSIQFRVESTGQWVTADQRNPDDEDGIRFYGMGSGGVQTFLYSDVPGNSWNPQKLRRAEEYIQENLIDVRVLLADLPSDDPDKNTDPALPHLFHDGAHLVHRSLVLSDVAFTDRLTFKLTSIV